MRLYLTKIFFLSFLFLCFSINLFSQVDTILVYRSEYEKVGDVIYKFFNLSLSYSISQGNESDFYSINDNMLIISKEIPDTFNILHIDILSIDTNGVLYKILKIVDAYDYFMANIDTTQYIILNKHLETYVDKTSQWTAFNNLWGKGDAQEGVDFRIATIIPKDNIDTSIFIWDVPSKASEFNGASVWCYVNVFWGNRMNIREDLEGFPFQIKELTHLYFTFNFEELFGNEQFKIALNTFLTDESYLISFSNNDGDFFMVFDQVGTWIPPYPYSLPDSIILGKTFAFLYKKDTTTGYEYRRVIIKNEEKLLSGTIDLKGIFDRFKNIGYLNEDQYIYHIQIGVEVTDGFGAVKFTKFQFFKDNLSIKQNLGLLKSYFEVYPTISSSEIYLSREDYYRIYDINGKLISSFKGKSYNISKLPRGVYFIKNNYNFTKRFLRF